MTVTPSSIDLKALLEKEVLQASPDLIRELLQIFINTLLSAEADAVCMLAEESGVPIWETLRASLEKKEPLTMIPVADSLQDTIFEAVRKHDHERGVDA